MAEFKRIPKLVKWNYICVHHYRTINCPSPVIGMTSIRLECIPSEVFYFCPSADVPSLQDSLAKWAPPVIPPTKPRTQTSATTQWSGSDSKCSADPMCGKTNGRGSSMVGITYIGNAEWDKGLKIFNVLRMQIFSFRTGVRRVRATNILLHVQFINRKTNKKHLFWNLSQHQQINQYIKYYYNNNKNNITNYI